MRAAAVLFSHHLGDDVPRPERAADMRAAAVLFSHHLEDDVPRPERAADMRAAAILFSHHLEDDVPHPVAGIAFHKCEILPGADRDLAVNEGNRDKGRQDQGVDVG